MSNAILAITDGTLRYSLITRPWQLEGWIPQDAPLKGGGVRRGSPLSDGTRLVDFSYANTIDTFLLKVMHGEQDGVIRNLQDMKRLLEKGRRYWTDDWATEPVWIEARGSDETNIRYAIIKDWSLPIGANPYAQPFFPQQQEAVMEGLPLTLEHDFWQAEEPGTGTATEISAQQDYCLETIFEPAESADDADTDSGAGGTISLVATTLSFGVDAAGDDLDAGIRFVGVTPPQGATICYAYIEGVCGVATAGAPCDTRIYGENNSTPALFTTYADFHGRARTIRSVDWNAIPAWILGTAYQTPDIANIVQEIVDRADWAPMNDMVIFIEEHGSATPAFRQMAAWDNAVYDAPKLIIYWMDGPASIRGRSATTAEEVYVANRHNEAQITNAYTWTAGAGPFSANLIGAALPFDIFTGGAGGPANGDITYFGCNTALPDSGPFSSLVFDIGSAAAYGAGDFVTWEYWNGAWVGLTIVDNSTALPCAEDESFRKPFVNSIHWEQPSDWATVAVNGVTGYWVRLVITEATGILRALQRNRDIYSIVWPFIELDATDVLGDLPALVRIRAQAVSECLYDFPNIGGYVNRIMIGLRSLDRDVSAPAFRSFINLSDEQNPATMSISVHGGAAFATDTETPSGRRITWSPGGIVVMADRAQCNWTAPRSWYGEYHLFVRYQVTSGNDGDLRLRAITSFFIGDPQFTTDTVDLIAGTEWHVADLGRIVLPPGGPSNISEIANMTLHIEAQNTVAAARVLHLYDFILMPVDEWFADVQENMTPSTPFGFPIDTLHHLDLDPLSEPKRLTAHIQAGVLQRAIYIPYTAGRPILQANADQKLHFFMMRNPSRTTIPRVSEPYLALRVWLERVDRYQSMRGDR